MGEGLYHNTNSSFVTMPLCDHSPHPVGSSVFSHSQRGGLGQVTRTVVVLAKCPPPSYVCVDSPLCATCVDGTCLCLSTPDAATEVDEAEPAYVPPVDTAPPVLTLLGGGERALIVGVNGGELSKPFAFLKESTYWMAHFSET